MSFNKMLNVNSIKYEYLLALKYLQTPTRNLPSLVCKLKSAKRQLSKDNEIRKTGLGVLLFPVPRNVSRAVEEGEGAKVY